MHAQLLARLALVVCLVPICAACDGTVTVRFSTGPQQFEVSTASFMLPTELRDGALIATVPCGPSGMCPSSSEVVITCEADVCDPAPRTISVPVGGVIDVDALLAETRELGIGSVESYAFGPVRYEVELNTLTVPTTQIDVYWGPEAATTIDPALGVRPFGVVPAIGAGQTVSGEMVIDPAGAEELSDFLTGGSARVRFFAETVVDLDPGDAFPEGSVRMNVNATITAVGSLLR